MLAALVTDTQLKSPRANPVQREPPSLPASQAAHSSFPERAPFKAGEVLKNSSRRRDKFLMNRQIGLEFAPQQLPQPQCLNIVLFSLMLRTEKEEVR